METVHQIARRIEKETGQKMPKHAEIYVLNRAQGKSKRDSLRETGMADTTIDKIANKLENNCSVKAFMDEINSIQVGSDDITPEFIEKALLKEVHKAKSSRDRQTALQSLGRARGMFKDVVEQTSKLTDEELVAQARKQLGNEAANKMAEELGINDS